MVITKKNWPPVWCPHLVQMEYFSGVLLGKKVHFINLQQKVERNILDLD